jgi:hypothetical protein
VISILALLASPVLVRWMSLNLVPHSQDLQEIKQKILLTCRGEGESGMRSSSTGSMSTSFGTGRRVFLP